MPAGRRLCRRRAGASQTVAQVTRGALESQDTARSDESANRIASHHEQAGLALRAIPCCQRAAALVRRRYAEDEAIAFLNTALRLLAAQPPSTERDRAELDLLISLGPSLSATQGFASEDAGKIYSRARLLCELLGETDRYITVLGGSWTFHIVRGDLEIAREIAQRYMALVERRDDCLLRAAGSFYMGSTSYYQGALRESRQHLEASNRYAAQSSAAFLELGPELGVFCRGHLTHAVWLLGEPDEANAECARKLSRAEGLSHPFSLSSGPCLRGLAPSVPRRAGRGAGPRRSCRGPMPEVRVPLLPLLDADRYGLGQRSHGRS